MSTDDGPTVGVVAVINGNRRVGCEPGATLVFGRVEHREAGIVGLDPTDRGISRQTCSVESHDGWWTVVNRSAKTPLSILAFGSADLLQLAPGAHHLINASPCIVHVRGMVRSHRIDLIVPVGDLAVTSVGDGQETDVLDIVLSEAERDALTAMFNGYLRPIPRRDPHPVSYEDAGRLLGVPASTVRRRIERFRDRLRDLGWFIEGPHARYELAELALERGWITPSDLDRLSE